MKSKIRSWIPAAFVILGMVGYQISKEFGYQIGSGTSISTTAGQTLLSADEEALSDKLQPFIKCLNVTDKKLLENMAGYNDFFQRVSADLKQVPGLGFRGFKIQVYETNNSFSRECITDLKEAITQKPSDAVLDKAGQDYAATLEALIPLMNEADNYYDQENYRDDKLAKGRDLHGKLSPLFTRISELSPVIHKSVQDHQDKLAEARLNAMEKANGKEFRWHTQNTVQQASRTLKAIGDLVDSNKIEPKELEDIEAQMQRAYDDAVAYATQNPNVKTRLGNQPVWFLIQSNVQNYLTAMKTLRRDVSDGKMDKISENLNRLSDQYNNLVRNYNIQVTNRSD